MPLPLEFDEVLLSGKFDHLDDSSRFAMRRQADMCIADSLYTNQQISVRSFEIYIERIMPRL